MAGPNSRSGHTCSLQVQTAPSQLVSHADDTISTFLDGAAAGPVQDKLARLLRQNEKAVPNSGVLADMARVLGNSDNYTSAEMGVKMLDLCQGLPDALDGTARESVVAFVGSLAGKKPEQKLLETLASGVRKVADPQKIISFLQDKFGSGRRNRRQQPSAAVQSSWLIELLDGFEDLPPTSSMVSQFTRAFADLTSAHNGVLNTHRVMSSKVKEMGLQTSFAASVKRSFGLGGGSSGADGQRCHPKAAISATRILDVKLRFEKQRKQYLQEKIVELLFKMHTQLEYTWLQEFPFELKDYTAATFGTVFGDFEQYVNKQTEKQRNRREGTVSYTVARAQYPTEFAQLGSHTVVRVPDTVGGMKTYTKPNMLTFTIEPPSKTTWHSMVYTDVKVYVLPFDAHEQDAETLEVDIHKMSPSMFITNDGRIENARVFQHADAEPATFKYRLHDCQQFGRTVVSNKKIRPSPYGQWELRVPTNTLSNKTRRALSQVQEIEFQFKVEYDQMEDEEAISHGIQQGKVPLFAHDWFSPYAIPEIAGGSDTAVCPAMKEIITTTSTTLTTTTLTTAKLTTTTLTTTTDLKDCAYTISDCTDACEQGAARNINITRQPKSVANKQCPKQQDIDDCQPGQGACPDVMRCSSNLDCLRSHVCERSTGASADGSCRPSISDSSNDKNDGDEDDNNEGLMFFGGAVTAVAVLLLAAAVYTFGQRRKGSEKFAMLENPSQAVENPAYEKTGKTLDFHNPLASGEDGLLGSSSI